MEFKLLNETFFSSHITKTIFRPKVLFNLIGEQLGTLFTITLKKNYMVIQCLITISLNLSEKFL